MKQNRNTTAYAAPAILDRWVEHDWSRGLDLRSVRDLSRIVVKTRNTTYEITVIDGAGREILIRGGKFFPEQTSARLSGSSMGGSFLKLGGIHAGFNMELQADNRTIVTSTVQAIAVHPPAS